MNGLEYVNANFCLFLSGGGSSSTQLSPPRSDQKERRTQGKDRSSSSVEDQAHTAADGSLCSDSVRSLLEEKGKAQFLRTSIVNSLS